MPVLLSVRLSVFVSAYNHFLQAIYANQLIALYEVYSSGSLSTILEMINVRCGSLSRWLTVSRFSFWKGRNGAQLVKHIALFSLIRQGAPS